MPHFGNRTPHGFADDLALYTQVVCSWINMVGYTHHRNAWIRGCSVCKAQVIRYDGALALNVPSVIPATFACTRTCTATSPRVTWPNVPPSPVFSAAIGIGIIIAIYFASLKDGGLAAKFVLLPSPSPTHQYHPLHHASSTSQLPPVHFLAPRLFVHALLPPPTFPQTSSTAATQRKHQVQRGAPFEMVVSGCFLVGPRR